MANPMTKDEIIKIAEKFNKITRQYIDFANIAQEKLGNEGGQIGKRMADFVDEFVKYLDNDFYEIPISEYYDDYKPKEDEDE